MFETESPYTILPQTGPHSAEVGHALITMVEPHLGHERAYNRWYEDDHIFSGALFLPWCFAGRRWVATRDLQQLRYPKENSIIANPVTKGCYLGTYWITAGRLAEHKEWSFSVYNRLVAEGRVNDNRDHVFTAFQDKVETVYRDGRVPKDVFTLMDPSAGLILEVVDAVSTEDRDVFESWLLTHHLPSRVKVYDSPVSSAMVFRTRKPDMAMSPELSERIGKIAEAANDPSRLTILWFFSKDPREAWPHFVAEAELIKASGLGNVALVAPFISSKMGTNAYDEMLRG
ncbi:hypothetical protein K432DRAFT_455652 [Lepidopterella palustris CBS 459.81]|uniref:Uncharacterized protein n=1 Tax=Lepidopterella palustris CBS 459.81 TaxID=1314670 RepID=A0A8E2E8R6_9PEZI|nr:hypothetical protein K432DRAFT_455652 [Lepidopterella palustris CBS 459.81]